jgi:hypothetical protein
MINLVLAANLQSLMDQFFDSSPPNAVLFLKHDIWCLKLIHEEGTLLRVNWKGVKEGLSLLVGRLIHQAIKVHMVHDNKAHCSTRQQIDINWLLAKKKVDSFIYYSPLFSKWM